MHKPEISPFLTENYQHHNEKRLEHLASLGIDISRSTLLEVGAGIGDHTGFFLSRGCQVVTSDAREENVKILKSRYPDLRVMSLDLNDPPKDFNETFDIVYCYGLLYHLHDPVRAIEFMSRCCRKMLLLETCVSFGDENLLNPCSEDALNPTQSVSGTGCRPTRRWVYEQLKTCFEHVYLPITQPDHKEFPLDWTSFPFKNDQALTRAIFVASREMIVNVFLVDEIPSKQIRYRP